jgi:uncharacterized protein with PQ loop repeat
MTEQIFTILGIIGNILLVTAYLPQISKIIKHKHADDLSLLMWINYLIGDFLLLVYAIYQNDAIVASLFTIMTIGNISILFLTFKYGHINMKKKAAKEKEDTKKKTESAEKTHIEEAKEPVQPQAIEEKEDEVLELEEQK